MKQIETKPMSAVGKLHLQLFWGPTDALAAGDRSRLATVTASLSEELQSWIQEGSPPTLNAAKTDLLVRSYFCAARDENWHPYVPQSCLNPLRFCLRCKADFIEIAVSVSAQGKHCLYFDVGNGNRN